MSPHPGSQRWFAAGDVLTDQSVVVARFSAQDKALFRAMRKGHAVKMDDGDGNAWYGRVESRDAGWTRIRYWLTAADQQKGPASRS